MSEKLEIIINIIGPLVALILDVIVIYQSIVIYHFDWVNYLALIIAGLIFLYRFIEYSIKLRDLKC